MKSYVFQMISVPLVLIHRYLSWGKEHFWQLGSAVNWTWQVAAKIDDNLLLQTTACFVERQGEQMAQEVKLEKRAVPA